LKVVLGNLVQGSRIHWSAAESCIYVCDSWGNIVWRQKVSGSGVDPEGEPEVILQTEPGSRDPVAITQQADGQLIVAFSGARHMVCVDPQKPKDQEPPVVGDVTKVEQAPLIDFVHDGVEGVYCSSLGTQITYSYIVEGKSLTQNIMTKTLEESADVDNGPWVVAGGLFLPLGLAMTADGRTLICSQLHTFHLWAWDRDPETGLLSNYRVWAELPGAYCHGLCLDDEGCAWVAVVGTRDDPWTWNCLVGGFPMQYYKRWATGTAAGGFVRVREGGKVLQRVMLRDKFGVGCTLGGPDGRTLYMGIAQTADGQHREWVQAGNSFVAAMRVAVGAADSARHEGATPDDVRQRSRL